MNPKISIITISFNSAKTIEETIKSVVTQDYNNKEYIIIDGKSTDSTLGIIEKYHDKIDIIVSEKDKGISDAFNKGIKLSAGELIYILNSDDVMMPGALSKIAEEYEPNVDIYRANMFLWNPYTNIKFKEVPTMKFSITPILCHVCHLGTVVSKLCYERIGAYDDRMKFMMDLDFLIRASQQKCHFKYVNFEMACFRQGGTTDVNGITRKKDEYIYMVKKNGGTMLRAFLYYYYVVATQITKHTLGKIMSMDRVLKLRYKKG